MVLVTATHFLFLTTHNQSEQSVNPLSIIKQRQSHSSKKEKKEQRKSSKRKVTNARSLNKPHIFIPRFFPPHSVFFPQIHEARGGGEADMVACDAGCDGVCSETEFIYLS